MDRGDGQDPLLSKDCLKGRLYMNQHQSFAKPKGAKLASHSSQELNSPLTGTASTSKPSTSTTAAPVKAATSASTSSPEISSKKMSTSHGERFCSARYAVPLKSSRSSLSDTQVEGVMEGWKTGPYAMHSSKTSRPRSASPKRRPGSSLSRRSTPSSHENWKRKRGKFALAEKQKPPDYEWMPFLGSKS